MRYYPFFTVGHLFPLQISLRLTEPIRMDFSSHAFERIMMIGHLIFPLICTRPDTGCRNFILCDIKCFSKSQHMKETGALIPWKSPMSHIPLGQLELLKSNLPGTGSSEIDAHSWGFAVEKLRAQIHLRIRALCLNRKPFSLINLHTSPAPAPIT